jgi:Major Facilitator Superfamily
MVERTAARSGSQLVLLTLAAGQFLMTLDSSVMNVSIATVADDLGTTVTGIQGAITAYTLVMATLMITGAKIGAMIGRKRAFAIGCVIYGAGSLTTALAPNLPVLPRRSRRTLEGCRRVARRLSRRANPRSPLRARDPGAARNRCALPRAEHSGSPAGLACAVMGHVIRHDAQQ